MIKKVFQFVKRTLTRPKGLALDSVHPVSEWMGEDRGTPIDRYYIQQFLSSKSNYIKGTVLEVASKKYILEFGTSLTAAHILHPIAGTPNADLVGDLTRPETLPDAAYDCFICTQTFHVIYNFTEAIRGAYKLLKPGGVLLATLGGIAQVSSFDMDRWGDYWRFTTLSAKRAFEEIFGYGNVEVGAFGNCLAATSMLRGISSEEIAYDKLNFYDKNFPVIVTVVASKPL